MSADEPAIVQATPSDLGPALPLIREFYHHLGFSWDAERKNQILQGILQSPEIGRLWLVRTESEVIGYALVIFYVSLEFNGRIAYLDEVYVRPEHRSKGLGGRVIDHIAGVLKAERFTALRLEVDEQHPGAATLYARKGFRRDPRELWTRAMRAGEQSEKPG